jgi:hypothetical protein
VRSSVENSHNYVNPTLCFKHIVADPRLAKFVSNFTPFYAQGRHTLISCSTYIGTMEAATSMQQNEQDIPAKKDVTVNVPQQGEDWVETPVGTLRSVLERPKFQFPWPILAIPQVVFPDFSETIEKPFDMIGKLLGDAPKSILSDRGSSLILRQNSVGKAHQDTNNAKSNAKATQLQPQLLSKQSETPYPFEGEILPLETFRSKRNKMTSCIGLTWPTPVPFFNSCEHAGVGNDFESVEMSAFMDDTTISSRCRPPTHILLNNEDPLMQQQRFIQQQRFMQQQLLLRRLEQKRQESQQQEVAVSNLTMARIGSSIRGSFGRQRKASMGSTKISTMEPSMTMRGPQGRTATIHGQSAKPRDKLSPVQKIMGRHERVEATNGSENRKILKKTNSKRSSSNKIQVLQKKQVSSFFGKHQQAKNEAQWNHNFEYKNSSRSVSSPWRLLAGDRGTKVIRGRSRSPIVQRRKIEPNTRSRSLETRPYYGMSPVDRARLRSFSGHASEKFTGQQSWEQPGVELHQHHIGYSRCTPTVERTVQKPFAPPYHQGTTHLQHRRSYNSSTSRIVHPQQHFKTTGKVFPSMERTSSNRNPMGIIPYYDNEPDMEVLQYGRPMERKVLTTRQRSSSSRGRNKGAAVVARNQRSYQQGHPRVYTQWNE